MSNAAPVCPACGGTECVGADFCGVTGQRIGGVQAVVPPVVPLAKRRGVVIAATIAVALFGGIWLGRDYIQSSATRAYRSLFEAPRYPQWDTDLVGYDMLRLAGIPVSAVYLPDDGFSKLKLQPRTGRLLSVGDAATAPPGAVMREELAFWLIRYGEHAGQNIQPQDFVGKQIRLGTYNGPQKTYAVIGVAGKGSSGGAGFQGELSSETSVIYLSDSLRTAPAP